MDILIKGMEMPKEIQCCYTIFPDGKVIVHWDGKVLGEAKAIELPSHGDLIERSKAHEAITQAYSINDVPSIIDQLVPTILEASND